MTYALVAADIPTFGEDDARTRNWILFSDAFRKTLANAKATETLAQNLWLLDLHSDMRVLSALLEQAARNQVSCQTLFFDQRPAIHQS